MLIIELILIGERRSVILLSFELAVEQQKWGLPEVVCEWMMMEMEFMQSAWHTTNHP